MVLNTDTVFGVVFTTYNLLPSKLTSKFHASPFVLTVVVSVFVEVLITEKVLLGVGPKLARYDTNSFVPSGLIANPSGPFPTGIVVITELVARLITEMVFD